MRFNPAICRRYCPYLHGRRPKFKALWSSSGTEFILANSSCGKSCVRTPLNAPLSMPDSRILSWMQDSIDVEQDLRDCPCYAEHLLNSYDDKT